MPRDGTMRSGDARGRAGEMTLRCGKLARERRKEAMRGGQLAMRGGKETPWKRQRVLRECLTRMWELAAGMGEWARALRVGDGSVHAREVR